MRVAPLARSASLRVTLLVAGGILILSLLAMALQYRVTAQALEGRQSAVLAADIAAFGAQYDQRRIPALRQAIQFQVDGMQASGQVDQLLLLQDREGRVLAGNLERWPEGLVAQGPEFTTTGGQFVRHDGVTYQAIARLLPGGFPLLVARSRSGVEATLAQLRWQILWVALALIALAFLAGTLVARAVLGRIGRLNALADRVAGGDMAARVPNPKGADEFAALDRHVNTMLDRIEALNAARGRLSDTIAHELRTPLNRILQHLSQIEGQSAPILAAQDEMRQTVRVFDALLDISSAEAAKGMKPGLVPVDIAALAQEVFDLYEALAEEKGVRAQAVIRPDRWVLGERSLIAQLVSNLLDNAIKFTPAGERLSLTVDSNAERILMRVEDSGPGIPPDMAERLFDRFTRAERDRDVAGHGLGLTLVQAIAARHGAKVLLPERTKGFALEISWPILNHSK